MITNKIENNYNYFVGMLRIDSTTLVPTSIQKYGVIGLNKRIDGKTIYIIIAFLSPEIISETYKECNKRNERAYKIQEKPEIYFTPLVPPLKTKEEDFIINKEITEAFKSTNVLVELNELKYEILKFEPILYNPLGITKEEILEIIKRFDLDVLIKQLSELDDEIKEIELLLVDNNKYVMFSIDTNDLIGKLETKKKNREILKTKIKGYKKDLNIKDQQNK